MILMEKIEMIGGYSKDKWEEFMPQGAKAEVTFSYRKRGAKVLDIKAVLEIPGNKNECEILFHDGEIITVNGTFAEVYESWIDAEELFFDDLENGEYDE